MNKKLIINVCLIIGLVLTGMSLTAASAKPGAKRNLQVVKGPIKPVALLPDLRIVGVEEGSTIYKLKVTVENRGFKASGPCVLRLRTLYDGTKYKTVYKSFPALSGFGLAQVGSPKNRITIEVGSSVPVYPSYNLLKIDVFNKVKETNENNNEGIGDWLIK